MMSAMGSDKGNGKTRTPFLPFLGMHMSLQFDTFQGPKQMDEKTRNVAKAFLRTFVCLILFQVLKYKDD